MINRHTGIPVPPRLHLVLLTIIILPCSAFLPISANIDTDQLTLLYGAGVRELQHTHDLAIQVLRDSGFKNKRLNYVRILEQGLLNFESETTQKALEKCTGKVIVTVNTNMFAFTSRNHAVLFDKLMDTLKPVVVILMADEWNRWPLVYNIAAQKANLVLYQYHLRRYNRHSNMLQIPLGPNSQVFPRSYAVQNLVDDDGSEAIYHHDVHVHPHESTPRYYPKPNVVPADERTLVWGFPGVITGKGRPEIVAAWRHWEPHTYGVKDRVQGEMLQILHNEVFAPCSRGNYVMETQRLDESSRAGAIVVLAGQPKREIIQSFQDYSRFPPWIIEDDWPVAIEIAKQLYNNKTKLLKKQKECLDWYKAVNDDSVRLMVMAVTASYGSKIDVRLHLAEINKGA